MKGSSSLRSISLVFCLILLLLLIPRQQAAYAGSGSGSAVNDEGVIAYDANFTSTDVDNNTSLIDLVHTTLSVTGFRTLASVCATVTIISQSQTIYQNQQCRNFGSSLIGTKYEWDLYKPNTSERIPVRRGQTTIEVGYSTTFVGYTWENTCGEALVEGGHKSGLCGSDTIVMQLPAGVQSTPTPLIPTVTPSGSPIPTMPPDTNGVQVLGISPIQVEPGNIFNPSVTIKVTSGSLTTGVDLHATPDTTNNTFGAWPQQGVHYTVSTGNTYTFSAPEHAQFVMTAPAQTGSYQSTWRLRKNGADFGPVITIPITVATVQHQHPIDYWDATYYASKDLSGSVAYQTTFTDQYIFKDWGIGSPASGIPVDNWSARFVREINFPGGDYHFHCQHDDGCRVLIDGTTKLDAWWDSSFDGHDWTGTLTAGFHEVKVEFYDQGGGAHIDMWWQGLGFLPRYPSCEPDQWCADYWGNKSVAGSPALTKNEGTSTFLNTGWGTGGPGYNLPTDYFSARVTRTLPFTCGTYRFHVTADDADRFYVDGILRLNEWTYKAQQTTDIDIQLSSGDHTLTLDYREDTGQTALQLSWDQIMACAPYSGSLTVSSGQTLFANTIQTAVTASGTSAMVVSSEGFAVGDLVLFSQAQGTTNVGKWETAKIVSMDLVSFGLDHPLVNTYDSSSGYAQVLKVPHYTSVTIQSGATLTALPWNGTTGGILAFQSDGTVTVNGTIDMNGKGYRGGAGSRRADGHSGQQGESYTNIGATCSTNGCNVKANNGGGGGSGGVFASGSGGGSGAGFASAGTNAP